MRCMGRHATQFRTGREAGAGGSQVAGAAAGGAADAAQRHCRSRCAAGPHEERHAVAAAVVAESGAEVRLAGPAATAGRAAVAVDEGSAQGWFMVRFDGREGLGGGPGLGR